MVIAKTLELLGQSEKLRFLLIGGYNTVFGYLSFALAYWWLGARWHYVFIAIGTHFIAVTHSFLTQRYWVFRSRGPWLTEFLRFHVAYLAMLPVGIGLLAFFFDFVGLPMLLAQACALVVSVCLSYLSSSRFTFRRRDGDPRP